MPRVKIKRKSTATDMTAMCDVAFLLLTFFIMTSKFKTDDPVPVAIPAYSKTVVLPDDNIATLTVGSDKVFFGVEGVSIRESMLDEMGKQYNIAFTPAEKAVFVKLPTFGVPVGNLKQFLDLNPDQAKTFVQTGIPTDSVSNELYNWIHKAREADRALYNKALYVTIKCDSKEGYPVVGKVIAILQKQKVNKFSLITAQKAAQ